ncbi:unnamed protein product [Citrullus colocynthis]|uniref:Uncharacterized protein n=1 Tax=Citrullus colocynthis TaxID=252529 RepID=A0ABP0XU36_9ROSI
MFGPSLINQFARSHCQLPSNPPLGHATTLPHPLFHASLSLLPFNPSPLPIQLLPYHLLSLAGSHTHGIVSGGKLLGFASDLKEIGVSMSSVERVINAKEIAA